MCLFCLSSLDSTRSLRSNKEGNVCGTAPIGTLRGITSRHFESDSLLDVLTFDGTREDEVGICDDLSSDCVGFDVRFEVSLRNVCQLKCAMIEPPA